MNKPIIAAQLYTIREYTQTLEDLERSMKKIKEIGYNAVQVSAFGPIEDEKIKEVMDVNGLRICATHISFDRMKEDLENVIKQHKLWECEYVGVGSMPKEYRASKEGFIAFAKEASQIAKELANNGLKLIYHNHNFEFRKFGGKTGMEILFEESDHELFNFEIDTYWVQAGGANPVDWIKKVKGRMDVVHFKDMRVSDKGEITMAEVGEGNMNWPAIIDACIEAGVKWAAVEQDICDRDPFESLKISLDNLKRFGLSS